MSGDDVEHLTAVGSFSDDGSAGCTSVGQRGVDCAQAACSNEACLDAEAGKLFLVSYAFAFNCFDSSCSK